MINLDWGRSVMYYLMLYFSLNGRQLMGFNKIGISDV